MIHKYARLIVRKGVNLQPDQILVITASIESAELVHAVVKEAYEVQAKDVIVYYVDDYVAKMRYLHHDADYFNTVPGYLAALRNDYAKENAAVLTITSEDPEAFKGVDPLKITTYQKAMHQAVSLLYEQMDAGITRWCIAGAPSQRWANKVFDDMSDREAMAALWDAIYTVSYVKTDDPCEAWEKHGRDFSSRIEKLNAMQIDSLHYTNSLGTDLTIGMNRGYLFAGGGSWAVDGTYFFPNIPTEEIFTTPDYKRVDGIVYSSLPLNFNGALVDEFWIRFENGRVVDYDAKVGKDVLTGIIETDEGAHYLGEAALVPYDSPISQLKILFYNTLYDENAACHLALGRGFSECIQNGHQMSADELYAHGINRSLTHVDFMIGTKDLKITAQTPEGEVVIFDEGCFTFD